MGGLGETRNDELILKSQKKKKKTFFSRPCPSVNSVFEATEVSFLW